MQGGHLHTLSVELGEIHVWFASTLAYARRGGYGGGGQNFGSTPEQANKEINIPAAQSITWKRRAQL